MAKSNWQYTEDQFLNATKGSYRLAVQLSNFHDARLSLLKDTIAALVPIYTRYHAAHLALVQAYNDWKNKEGDQVGKTETLKQAFKGTYDQMPQIDRDIQVVFLPKTPEYKGIFAEGKKPFTKGKIDDRVNAWDTLGKRLAPYAALAAVKAEVDGFYDALDTLRDNQEGAKGSVKSGSGNVDATRMAAMTMQWRDVGFAIDQFWNDIPFIESMFDLESLRTRPQTKFTATLAPSENKAVATHTFLSNDKLRLKNTALGTMRFYLATTVNGTNSTFVEVTAGQNITIDISAFGISDYSTHRFLTAVNQSATDEAKYLVEIK